MKCDLCKAEVEKLYTFFDKEICEVCKRQIEEDMDVVEFKGIANRRGNIWVTNQLNKFLTETNNN